MQESKNYSMIKEYYDSDQWELPRVHSTVGKSLGITEEEYFEITGLAYPDMGGAEP